MSCVALDPSRMRRWAVVLAAIALVVPAAFAQQPQQAPTPAAQTLAPAAQVAPAPKPPVFNRVNDVMPAWLRIRGEFRERVEGFDGAGFVEDRRDLYYPDFRSSGTKAPLSPLDSVNATPRSPPQARGAWVPLY